MSYDPRCTRFPYTELTDGHYLTVKKDDGTVFDEHYPYIDHSRRSNFIRAAARLLLVAIVFPLTRVKLGLRVVGRDKIRKNKELFTKGVISCANHVALWDYLAIGCAIRPFKPHVLVWAPNIRGENGPLMRAVGGIPIPENDVRATAACMQQCRRMLDEGGWLHIYPEGSMWEYYAPIRPFKPGIGYFACQCDKPVLPMGFSYRKPSVIREKLFHQPACFTLTIGEPIFADASLPLKEREEDLIRRCHAAVCRLAGIAPEENRYAPIYDHSRRIDD